MFRAVGGGLLVLLFFLSREWSWRSYRHRQNERIRELDSEIEHALLRLHIADTLAAENSCYAIEETNNNSSILSTKKPIAEMSLMEFEELVTTRREKAYNEFKSKGALNKMIVLRPHILDMSGLTQTALLVIMGLVEIHYGHSIIYSEKMEDLLGNDVNFQGNRVYRRFISHRLPLSGFAVHALIWIAGLGTWLGIVDRSSYVFFALRLLLHWVIAAKAVFWFANVIVLKKYLPSIYNLDELKLKLFDYKWWLWLIGKIIAPDGVWTFVRLVLSLYLAMPVRYFYYFCSTCHLNTAASIEDIASSWFLVNIILHISALVWWTCILRLNAFGTPIWFRLLKTDNLKVLLGMGILNVISGVFCLFRVLYFAYYANCSWWGSLMALIFFHIFILEIGESLPHMLSLIGKYGIYEKEQEIFVSSFVSHVTKTTEGGAATGIEVSEADVRQAEVFANRLYSAVIDKTMRNYILGVGDITYSTQDSRGKKEEAGGRKEEWDQYKDLTLCYKFTLRSVVPPKKDGSSTEAEEGVEKVWSNMLGVHL